jgi:nucleotidyltransferase substrate binding protein (TIGR01987 family)
MATDKLSLLIQNLGDAINSFDLSLKADLSKYNELEVDWIKNGQIQKFEYNVELLWKTIKEFFKVKFESDVNFPLENIREFFRQDLINEETYNTLYDAIKSRNLLSHIYKLEMFETIHPKLSIYLSAIKTTYEAVKLHTL